MGTSIYRPSRYMGSSEHPGRGCITELPQGRNECCCLLWEGSEVFFCPISLPWSLPVIISSIVSIHRTLTMKIPAGGAHIMLYLLELL
jgi:hypothetical protein